MSYIFCSLNSDERFTCIESPSILLCVHSMRIQVWGSLNTIQFSICFESFISGIYKYFFYKFQSVFFTIAFSKSKLGQYFIESQSYTSTIQREKSKK